MQRAVELEPPVSRYVEMIIAASEQMTELLEELGEARHVHALLRRVEVDVGVDAGVVEQLGAGVGDPDHLVDAGDAGAGQSEVDVRLGGLQVMGEG